MTRPTEDCARTLRYYAQPVFGRHLPLFAIYSVALVLVCSGVVAGLRSHHHSIPGIASKVGELAKRRHTATCLSLAVAAGLLRN
eukprot:COSAG01_NODE_311_length_19072_cov_73.511727_23_plen_84_part_00